MTLTTPNSINKDVLDFCQEIDSTTKPIFVKFFPIKGYKCEDCYGNVERHIKKNGGRVQHGWIIWLDPEVFIEAEFHVIWVNNEEEYIDVTPKADKEEKILFLPDSERIFTGELIDNIRKPLVDNAHTRTMVKVGKRKFEIDNKYYDGNPEIKIPESEIKDLRIYQETVFSSEIQKDKLDGKIKIGRNEPCPCGSGKKYKRCCIEAST